MKHFKLTDETIVNAFGVKLFRIELTVDCKWGKIGDKGGFVEKESNLDDGMIYGNAQVFGDARVYGNAQVYCDARVYGNAQVFDDAQVYGNAWVYDNAQVYGDARVYGNAQVFGDARVYGNAQVYGNAWEESPLQIQGTRNFFNVCSKWKIKIGCYEKTFKEWKKEYKQIGKENGYTPEQIKEYGLYIDLAIKRYTK